MFTAIGCLRGPALALYYTSKNKNMAFTYQSIDPSRFSSTSHTMSVTSFLLHFFPKNFMCSHTSCTNTTNKPTYNICYALFFVIFPLASIRYTEPICPYERARPVRTARKITRVAHVLYYLPSHFISWKQRQRCYFQARGRTETLTEQNYEPQYKQIILLFLRSRGLFLGACMASR